MEKREIPSKDEIEVLAEEVYSFLVKHEMWFDTSIFYNGKKKTAKGSVKEGFVVEEDVEPDEYVGYCMHPNILTMIFEGPLCYLLNYAYDEESEKLIEEFKAIFSKHNLFYELGYSWSLSCYPV